MSPDLFNLYSEVILRNLDESEGLKANGENLNNLRYADDTSLLAGSEEDLQRLLNIVVEESEKLGLSLSVKKTECMVVSKKKNNPECKLFSKGEQIRQVQKFKYLGYIMARKRTNESIFEETNQERSLINTIRKRQLKFLGHICRLKGLEFLSLTGKKEGTRSRGRQRISFLDSLSSFVTGNNKDNIALLRMTEDRDRWRIMIADVCSRQGI